MSNAAVVALNALSLVGFAALWCGLLWLSSALDGWRTLAKRFRAAGAPPPNRQWLVWGSLGWVNYRSILVVGHSEEGLYLSVLAPFRPFRPPLLIPWQAIVGRTTMRRYFRSCEKLEIEGFGRALYLTSSTTQPFQRYLPGQNGVAKALAV